MTKNATQIATHVRAAGIIAIIRGNFPLPRLSAIAEALAAGGVAVVEITLNSQHALAGITFLRQQMGHE